MIKILHTADWHIGSFNGPEKDGENERFGDIISTLLVMVDKARSIQPDFIVFSGDMFHAAKVWSDRGLRENRAAFELISILSKTAPIVILRGTPNHDSEEQYDNLKVALAGNSRVKFITEPSVVTMTSDNGQKVVFCGVPGFDRGYFRAKNPGVSKEEESKVFTEALDGLIVGLRASAPAGIPSVLLAHFTVISADMESGQTAIFGQNEPVIYPSTINAAGYTVSCFGHIHKPQQLEGCKDAFYSGAVARLNFNDEGQERGFWVHQIDETTNTRVTSDFFSLPGREFTTIRLDDKQVAEWISGSKLDIERSEIEEKIVRVIYSCTDEHNKALNTAEMSSYLRSHGAFWVHEIKPDKITSTVNTDVLKEAQTPEENLTAYLQEKETPAERIARVIELARPIIQEAEAKADNAHHAGMFVPQEIEVKNYRNYHEEKFSYADIHFCTINGMNGAGKSSLFMDAMLDALYEEPREGELTGWISNDTEARSGSIKFTFFLGDDLFRVTRTRQKNGRATLNLAQFVDADWQDRSCEKLRDTQTAINSLLGMDSLTLKACALIMQDQYGLFLQADKEARMNILGNILGLGIYDKMESIAAAAATETNRELRAAGDQIAEIESRLPDIAAINQEIGQAEEQLDTATATSEEANSTIYSLNSKIAEVDMIAEQIAEATSEQARLYNEAMECSAAITEKTGELHVIDLALAKEGEIAEHIAKYEQLIAREKELIAARSSHEALEVHLREARAEYLTAKGRVSELSEKLNCMQIDIDRERSVLSEESSLKHQHEQLADARVKLHELEQLATEKMKAEAEIAAAVSSFEHEKEKAAQLIKSAEIDIERKREQAKLLADSGCPIGEKASCRFLAAAIKAKDEIPQAEDDLEGTRTELEAKLSAAHTEIEAMKERYSEALAFNPSVISEARAELSVLEEASRKYMALSEHREKLKALEARTDEITEALRGENQHIEDCLASVAELERQIAADAYSPEASEAISEEIKAESTWLALDREIPVYKEKRIRITAEIERESKRKTDIELAIEKSKAKEASLRERLCSSDGKLKLEDKLRAAESAYKAALDMIRAASAIIGAKQKQLEDCKADEAKISQLKNMVNTLAERAADLELLKQAFSQDGIPHSVIRSILPVFESTATSILASMSGGSMSVEFITEKTLKSNNKKEVATLDIIINDATTGRLPYMSRSGGERVKAALSVILALSEIKSTKAGIQLGFLFIDEPPFLDGPGVQAYCDALEAIQRRYSSLKVMAITHDPAMKSRFPESVDVVKTADGSKVIYS